MAQAGFLPIQTYYSTTALATPSASNLANGELAVNITDGILYYKDNTGNVQVIASKASAGGVTSFLTSLSGLTPATSTTGAVTLAGTLGIPSGGTGLTALGTGVQTAFGINIGTAGSMVVNGGALGTPSSGTVTNLTGTASININGTVGGTTPTTGQFTTGWAANLTLTDAATIAWDTSTSQVATFTFVSTNRTMGAPTNLKNGAFYALAVIQNGGSNTLTFNSVFKWASGTAPTLSTAAGAKDYFTFRSDGTNLYQQGISQAVA
jgi:hypothetical protein